MDWLETTQTLDVLLAIVTAIFAAIAGTILAGVAFSIVNF